MLFKIVVHFYTHLYLAVNLKRCRISITVVSPLSRTENSEPRILFTIIQGDASRIILITIYNYEIN